LLHFWQMNLRWSLCIRSCSSRCDGWMNPLSHTSQINWRTPVCISSCRLANVMPWKNVWHRSDS